MTRISGNQDMVCVTFLCVWRFCDWNEATAAIVTPSVLDVQKQNKKVVCVKYYKYQIKQQHKQV